MIDIDFDMAFQVWSVYSGVSTSVLRKKFPVDAYHERGEIDAGEYFDSLRHALDIKLTDTEFEEGWNAILGQEISGVTALLAQLKKTYSSLYTEQFQSNAPPILGKEICTDVKPF